VRAVFVYGFAKSERSNISAVEVAALKELASELLRYGDSQIDAAISAGELTEIPFHE
jgi:hypothetical protein